MSKQLLHVHQSNVVVAALNDRAFAVVMEDGPPPNDPAVAAVALELMPPAEDHDGDDAAVLGEDTGDGHGDERTGGETNRQQHRNQQQQKKKKQKKRRREANNNGDPREIQSVCCTRIGPHNIWFAVSREDKTLSLYSVLSSTAAERKRAMKSIETQEEGKERKETEGVRPDVTYNLPKRARCLAFCVVPSSSSSTGSKCLHVVIAGDLSGDAIAFPVPNETRPPSGITRRLLLGHTASILTGLSVVPTNELQQNRRQQQLILTADRDEKVRVSLFPESHIIHGYLLGHTSFISTMGVAMAQASPGRTWCITGSGDGTVRLWDYQSCREIGMVPIVINNKPGVEKVDDRKRGESEEQGKDDKEDVNMDGDCEQNEEGGYGEKRDSDDSVDDGNGEQNFNDGHVIAVPFSVALAPDAEYLTVARDGIHSIDIHPIPLPSPPKKLAKTPSSATSLLLPQSLSLHEKQTLACSSQPLDVNFLSDGSLLALVREPEYLAHYRLCADGGGFEEVSSSPLVLALRGAAESRKVVMPMTTLERDSDGGLKLQKNRVNDNAEGDCGNGAGLHWNDAGRRETAKLAEQRRRSRRREKARGERKS